jgi:hypothetical protein
MARWLQSTVQGMLNPELADTTIPCADAQFSKSGDPRYYWTEYVKAHGEDISLTWFDIRGQGEVLAARTGRAAFLDLGAGVFGELDRRPAVALTSPRRGCGIVPDPIRGPASRP